LDFDPSSGHEQAGWRPALVVSEERYNSRVGLMLVCPVTTQVKGFPFEVPVPDGGKIRGVVLSDHVKSVDYTARKAKFIEAAPSEVLRTVRRYIALLIGEPR
jgi:mRNA interferase MazF